MPVDREDQAVLSVEGSGASGVGPAALDSGWSDPGETNSATFKVRVSGNDPVEGTVQILSTRGGVLNHRFTVGGN